ncbi:MAG: cation:proton antiporter [Candidatus Levybacteria bacterium]|nr:cation:proton antiporter [Candidatus Levybacteria bacterium]
MGPAFIEITVIVCLAAILSYLFRILKQPAILAYILTGILIGFLGFFDVSNHDLLNTLAQLGITFLLFTLGLEIKIKNFASISKVVFVVASVQMLFSFLAGYIASLLFGFSVTSAIYIGIALMFSSTVIVVKMISERKEFHSLYGKIAVGILLIQDLLAIGILVFLSAFNPQFLSAKPIFVFSQILLKGFLLFAAVFLLQKYVFPKVTEKLARSTETLFLASIAWVFGLSALVSSTGFSVEIGGFLAGIALANSIVNYQIIARAKILQDFFIVLFFVLLGAQMVFVTSLGGFLKIFIPALTLSFLALVIKPFIVMIIMGVMGYKKRTSFLTGVSLAQISEFSLITVFLGQRLGHVSNEVISIVTFSAIITFTLSTYLLSGNKDLYKAIHRYLSFLELVPIKREDEIESPDGLSELKNHVVLIGGDQMGQSILNALEDIEVEVVVVDFDPEILKNLEIKKVHRLYGDISDLDIQERAKLDSAKLVISTNPDLEDNLLLLKELKHENRRAKVVVMAFDTTEAKNLYKAGADYVILPHLAGGRQIAKLISENHLDGIENLKRKDLEYIK